MKLWNYKIAAETTNNETKTQDVHQRTGQVQADDLNGAISAIIALSDNPIDAEHFSVTCIGEVPVPQV